MKTKILYLGYKDSFISKWLFSVGYEIIHAEYNINGRPDTIKSLNCSYLISYGYQHILRKDILDLFPDKAINLHISYLPYNRGADPNLWSWYDGTPKGYTIHYLNYGVDTGDIIHQEQILFNDNITLRESYEHLNCMIQIDFVDIWNDIKLNRIMPIKQTRLGTFHKKKDRKKIEHLLTKGWDTPASEIINKGKYLPI